MTRHPDFPVELWDDILGRIHSQNDLLGLAGSSRRFHAIAERELYCSPNLFEHQLDTSYSREETVVRLRQLIRTIVTRPTVGALVKALRICVFRASQTRFYDNFIMTGSEGSRALDCDAYDMQILVAAAIKLGLPTT